MPNQAQPAFVEIHTPIGSIVSWYAPEAKNIFDIYRILPRNWVLCDGSPLNELHHLKLQKIDVDPSLYQKVTPNLVGRFIRGAGSAQGIDLTPGGADSTSATLVKTDTQGEHHHSMAAGTTTGLIVNSDAGLDLTPYRTVDDHQFTSADAHLRVDVDSGNHEGQHRHELSDMQTSEAGQHVHEVSIPSLPIIPPFVGLWFIIRIK